MCHTTTELECGTYSALIRVIDTIYTCGFAFCRIGIDHIYEVYWRVTSFVVHHVKPILIN